jgi:hypothetical protein
MNRRTIGAIAVLACHLAVGCRPVPVAGPDGSPPDRVPASSRDLDRMAFGAAERLQPSRFTAP